MCVFPSKHGICYFTVPVTRSWISPSKSPLHSPSWCTCAWDRLNPTPGRRCQCPTPPAGPSSVAILAEKPMAGKMRSLLAMGVRDGWGLPPGTVRAARPDSGKWIAMIYRGNCTESCCLDISTKFRSKVKKPAFHTAVPNVEINRKNKLLFHRFIFLGVKAAQSHKSGTLMTFCLGWAALHGPRAPYQHVHQPQGGERG